MKRYLRSCPHHGFNREAILSGFYQGVLSQYRTALDTASYGSFIQSSVEDGEMLIENLAESDRCQGGSYDRTVREYGSSSKRGQENNDRHDKVTLLKPRQVQFVDDQAERRKYYQEDRYDEQDEEINYVNNQRYQPGQTHPNLSYRNPNVENAQDQVYPSQQRQGGYGYQNQQGYQNRPTYQQNQQNWPTRTYVPPGNPQRNQGTNNYSGPPSYAGNQNRQWNSSHVGDNEYQQGTKAISQAMQDEEEMKGMLRYMMQLMDTSGKKLSEISKGYEKLAARVTIVEQQNQQINEHAARNRRSAEPATRAPQDSCKTAKPDPLKEPVVDESDEDRPLTPAEAEAAAIMIKRLFGEPKEERIGNAQTEPIQEQLPIKIATKKSPDEMPFELKETPAEDVEAAETLEAIYAGLERASAVIENKVQPTDPIEWGLYNCLLDEIETRKSDVSREMQATTGFSRIIPRPMPEKLEDPGAFTLPCEIGNTLFPKCLTDLGACTSIMPYSTSKALRLYDLRPSRTSLVMADGSKTNPVGLLRDVKVRVGGVVIPTDFMVVEMENEPEDPIILGRPFLATAGAKIDLKQDRIELHFGDQRLDFSRKKPSNDLVMKRKISVRGTAEGTANRTKPSPTLFKGGLHNIPIEGLLKTLDAHMGNSGMYTTYEQMIERARRKKIIRPPVIRDWPPNTGPGMRGHDLPWNNNIRVVNYVQEIRRNAPSNIEIKDPGDETPKRRRSENWPV